MDSSVSPKEEISFLHRAITFQTQSTTNYTASNFVTVSNEWVRMREEAPCPGVRQTSVWIEWENPQRSSVRIMWWSVRGTYPMWSWSTRQLCSLSFIVLVSFVYLWYWSWSLINSDYTFRLMASMREIWWVHDTWRNWATAVQLLCTDLRPIPEYVRRH